MGGGFDVDEGGRTTTTLSSWPSHVGAVIDDQNMGSKSELVTRISGAQLFLVDVEESVLMQCGDFSMRLLKQDHSPLGAVVASVGEVQWPVGKDAPILKVWNRRYTFALPGLVYGLSFPDSTPPAVLQQLESVMDQYCTFEIHEVAAYTAGRQQNIATNGQRDVGTYWTAVAPDVQTTSATIARQICSTSRIVADSILMGGDWMTLGIQQGGEYVKSKVGLSAGVAGESDLSPRILKRIQQARRMSAVAKLMSKTLLKGAISVSTHVGTGLGLDHVNANTIRSMSMSRGAAAAAPGAEDGSKPVAVASVDAFAKVVEAVETAGKSVYAATKAVGTDLVQQRFGADAGQVVQDSFGVVGNAIDTAWTLNKFGLKMLLQVTAASTMLSTKSRTTKRAKLKTSTTTTTTTDHNVQQQPAASINHLSPTSTMSDQQIRLQQKILQPGTRDHQLLQNQEMIDNLNLIPSDHQHAAASTLPQTQIFFGPAATTQQQQQQQQKQQPASTIMNSFTPRAAAEAGYFSQATPGLQSNSAFDQYKPFRK